MAVINDDRRAFRRALVNATSSNFGSFICILYLLINKNQNNKKKKLFTLI
jgi:hypothetical protein